MNITKTSLEKLPIPKQIEEGKTVQKRYYDDKLKGFGVRVTSGGTKAFFVEKKIRHTKKLKRFTIARYPEITVEEARRLANEYIGDMVKGHDPSPSAEKQRQAERDKKADEEAERKALLSTTLEQAFCDYLDNNSDLKERTAQDYKEVFYSWLKDWLHTPLIDITDDVVKEMHAVKGRVAEGKKGHARANYAVRLVRAVFNFAIGYYKYHKKPVFTYNPVPSAMKKNWYKVERRRTVIKEYQLPAWFNAVLELKDNVSSGKAEAVRDYLLVLIFTGLRRNEAAKLKWIDVDFYEKSIKITDTKNGNTHVLPCSDYLFDILRRRQEKCRQESPDSPYVFPGYGASGHLVEPKKQIMKVIDSSGVQFCMHDLRRSFATYAKNLGISHLTIKNLLNHSMRTDVTLGYIIEGIEQLRKPMQMITDYILHHAGIKENKVVSLISDNMTYHSGALMESVYD